MPDAATILDPTLGWLLLALFSVGWIGLGIYWGRRAKDLDGFMVAGRNVGLALGTATAVATWITSNTTMLAPQFALQLGIWGMLAYSTASIGLFLFAPLARRIRAVMPHGFTSVEFVRLRYGSVAQKIFLVISLFYCMTWMVSMAMAGGKLLEILAGIPYFYGMTIILSVCVIYTLFGGLFAVIGTDFIQSVIILIGVVVVAVAVTGRISLGEIHMNLVEKRPALLDALFPAAIMALFNNMFFGIGEIVHSNVWWSRAFAMREDVGRKAYLLAGVLWLPIPIVAGFLGLAAPAMDIPITSPDVVGPIVAAEVLGSVGAILVFIVVFCSIASSIDSLLAATSDVVTTEIVRPLFLKDAGPQALRRAATGVIIGIGVVTWLICLPNVGTLATVLFFAGPLVGSAIFPIVTGLYWERASAPAAVAAMVLGTACGLWAYFELGWYTAALVGTGVSFIVTMIGAAMNQERFDFRRLAAEDLGS